MKCLPLLLWSLLLAGTTFHAACSLHIPLLSRAMTYVKSVIGISSYHPHAVARVRSSLEQHVQGQADAITEVMDAIDLWFARQQDPETQAPLVLHLVGTTGVGKTYTAGLVARSVLNGRPHAREVPGLLLLSGTAYGVSEHGSEGVAAAQLATDVVEHLRACGGTGVVILDEMQKLPMQVLAVLKPALDAQVASLAAHPASRTNSTLPMIRASTAHAMFILISDLPEFAARRILAHRPSAAEASKQLLSLAIQRFKGSAVPVHASSTVALLPLQPEQAAHVVGSRLDQVLPVHAAAAPCSVEVQRSAGVDWYAAAAADFTRISTRAGDRVLYLPLGGRSLVHHAHAPVPQIETATRGVLRRACAGNASGARLHVKISIMAERDAAPVQLPPEKGSDPELWLDALREKWWLAWKVCTPLGIAELAADGSVRSKVQCVEVHSLALPPGSTLDAK